MEKFRKIVAEMLKDAGIDDPQIEVPQNSDVGDYAFPCFSLARTHKKAPAAIAQELKAKITLKGPIAKVENNGPYLNFFIDKSELAKDILSNEWAYTIGTCQHLGEKQPRKIMVEYSSPNTNKPLHLGHLRNILTGKSVSNILKCLGNDVVQSCVVNDRGIHICKSMLMYLKYGQNREPDKKLDHFVGDYYVMFNNKGKDDPGLEKEAQELLQRWEAGDEEVIAVWKKMNSWAHAGFEETYKKLDIRFDRYYLESDLYKEGKEIVHKGLSEGILQKEDGAIIADLDELGKKVLIRSDGTSLYITQDLYLARKKFDDFNLDMSIYVVASEQNLHFQQLFRLLKMLGSDIADKCYHLSYGMVYLPEGKMKSREGTVVDADDMIDEMKALAADEIQKRHELQEDEKKRRAAIIGLGALRFFLLKTDPTRDIVYDPKQSISFEGETGPYVQYAYARISSILRKSGHTPSKIDYGLYDEQETQMVRHLGAYPDIIVQAELKPYIICRYLLKLSQDFNEYYHSTPILQAEKDIRDARIILISAIRDRIKAGLELLGIDVLEEM